MKKTTVRTKTIDHADGTSITESERTEEQTYTGNGLIEAWGAFVLFFATFLTCVVVVRALIVPSQAPVSSPPAHNSIQEIKPSNI